MNKWPKSIAAVSASLLVAAISFQPASAAEADSKYKALYSEVAKLQGQDALKFFQSLPSKGVKGADVIDFFIDLPVSGANKQINKLFTDEGFQFYLDKYPRGNAYSNFQWK